MKELKLLATLLILISLSGCWDQRLLKDASLVLGIGFDLTESNKIRETIVFPSSGDSSSSSNGPKNKQSVAVISSDGNTANDARMQLDLRLADRYAGSKSKIILFGESLAKKGLYAPLDGMYRDPKGPLQAKVAIVSGEAKEVLNLFPPETPLSSEYLPSLLQSAEEVGNISLQNVQSICTLIFTEGKDVILPYIEIIDNGKRAKLVGTAMFHKDKLVGKLNINESKLLVIMQKKKHNKVSLNLKVDNKQEDTEGNYVSVEVIQAKTNLLIEGAPEKPTVNVTSNLKLKIKEYPKDHLFNQKELHKLNNQIEKSLKVLATKTIKKAQEKNCDALGIGLKLHAYHYDYFKNIDWSKEYKNYPINIKINSEIISNGLIN